MNGEIETRRVIFRARSRMLSDSLTKAGDGRQHACALRMLLRWSSAFKAALPHDDHHSPHRLRNDGSGHDAPVIDFRRAGSRKRALNRIDARKLPGRGVQIDDRLGDMIEKDDL